MSVLQISCYVGRRVALNVAVWVSVCAVYAAVLGCSRGSAP